MERCDSPRHVKQSGEFGLAVKNKQDTEGYWKATKRLTVGLLIIWFLASYGAGILFRDALDNFSLGGAPLGFWFAQNGAIYVFLMLIVVYCIQMTKLEKKYGISGERKDSPS